MYRLLSLVVTMVLSTLMAGPVFAQEPEVISSSSPNMDTGEIGTLPCFDYYSFGSVTADLQTNLAHTAPGSTIEFTGEVVNNNPYPLVDGTLYVKIFRKDEATFAVQDGNEVVDQFVIEDDMVLPANGSVPVSYSWEIPAVAEGGEYYAGYFFATTNRYNLMGLSFTDDVTGNQASFIVETPEGAEPIAKLSKTDTTINGRDHSFAHFPLIFSATDTITIRTTITNPTDQEKTMPLQWKQYAWDAMNPDNIRNTKTEVITLAPNETKEISYEVKEVRESVVYVTAVTEDRGAKSILNIRYVRDGVPETRINFPGITKFPLIGGEAQTLFACAHSTNVPTVMDNVLKLTLTDRTGNVIHEYRYQGDITSAMNGFGETFTPVTDHDYVLLTATLERDGVLIEDVEIEYDCRDIDPESCFPESETPAQTFFDKIFTSKFLLYSGTVILILLLVLVWSVHRRHKKIPHINASDMTTPLIFLLLFMPAVFLGSVMPAEAKSVAVMGTALGSGSWGNGGPYCAPNCGGWTAYVGHLYYHLNAYNADTNALIAEGATVPAGTRIEFRPDFDSEYLYWFSTGGSIDSPYGEWVPASTPLNPVNSWWHRIPAMTYNHSGSTAGLSCNGSGSLCTVTSAGVIETTATFGAAQWASHFTGSVVIEESGTTPAQTLTYPINVSAPTNNPPNTPTISGPANGQTGTNYTFNVSGADPNGDTLRYGITNSSCSTVSQWLPSSGYVSSGTARSFSRSWASTGSYTLYVLAEDSKGARSGCDSHTITIAAAPVATANLTINGSNGPLTVGKSTTLNLSWTSANAASCTLYGAGLAGGGVALNGNTSVSASVVTSSPETYVLTCGTASDSVRVSVNNQPPSAPSISGPTSGDAGSNHTFGIRGTDPDNDQIYYEIDWDNNGTADISTPASSYVNSGTTRNASRSWTNPNSYTFRARTVDFDGARSGWTSHTITINAGPPTVSLEVRINSGGWSTGDQAINPGDSVSLRWNSTDATSCTGSNFNTGGATSHSGASATPPNPGSSVTYQISCSGSGGSAIDAITVTTRQRPNFTQPSVSAVPSATYDPVTGIYDFVTVTFQTQNDGGSNTQTAANYSVEFDRGSNGYDETESGSAGTFTVGQAKNFTEVFTDVPFSTSRVRVTIDSTNAVEETNESDNVRTLEFTVPPPDPELSIEADRTLIRANDQVVLTWSAVAAYQLNCTVTGPAGINVTDNAAPYEGSATTNPITAKSEFVFSCTEPLTGTVFSETEVVEITGTPEEI